MGVETANNELEMPVVHSCCWLGKQNNVALSASCCVAVHAMDKGWRYRYPLSVSTAIRGAIYIWRMAMNTFYDAQTPW